MALVPGRTEKLAMSGESPRQSDRSLRSDGELATRNSVNSAPPGPGLRSGERSEISSIIIPRLNNKQQRKIHNESLYFYAMENASTSSYELGLASRSGLRLTPTSPVDQLHTITTGAEFPGPRRWRGSRCAPSRTERTKKERCIQHTRLRPHPPYMDNAYGTTVRGAPKCSAALP